MEIEEDMRMFFVRITPDWQFEFFEAPTASGATGPDVEDSLSLIYSSDTKAAGLFESYRFSRKLKNSLEEIWADSKIDNVDGVMVYRGEGKWKLFDPLCPSK